MASPIVNSTNLYERLGLERDATIEQVKQAYRNLVRQYPPERAPEEFKRIREAYEALGNPGTRTEYDRSISGPDSALAKVNVAMQASDYTTAELLLKQILLVQPDLTGARNLLGLCLLYQGKADDALGQFGRLLRAPGADASVWANTGHAYASLKRYADAENCFKEAVERAPGDAGDYYSAWADLWIERQDYKMASSLLEKGIKADKRVDFDDVALFLKLLEVRLFQRDDHGIATTLDALVKISTDEDQKKYVAWKLGALCQQLVRFEAFTRAIQIAQVAKRLQPDDIDYDALRDISAELELNNHDAALKIVRSRVSFSPGGWLQSLGPSVLAYCKEKAVFNGMKPIAGPPSLRTINTVGTALYGRRDYDEGTDSYIATLYFVIAFVPLFPLACYRVRTAGSGWRFLGKVPLAHEQKVHLGLAVAGVLFFIVIGRLSSNSSPSTSSVSTSAPSEYGLEPARPSASPPSLFSPAAVYSGSVINEMFKDTPGTLRVTLDSVADTTTGYVTIGRPLGGSGPFYGVFKPDSVYLVTGNATGDTIVWAARRIGNELIGRYMLVGGPMRGQRGTWNVHWESGLPSSSH
jgi:tetratricopeptide (TPR) repeat protein